MNRLKLVILFLMRGDVYRANLVLWNYYDRVELYKGDEAKTLQMIGELIDGKYMTMDTVKRCINVIEETKGDTWASYKHSKLDNYTGGQKSAEENYRHVEERYGHLLNFDLRFTGIVLDYHHDVLD